MAPLVRPTQFVFVVAALLACSCNKSHAASGPSPSSDECDKLFKHESELIAPSGASETAKQAGYASLVKSDVTSQWCEKMTRSAYDCSMKAATKAAFDACRD